MVNRGTDTVEAVTEEIRNNIIVFNEFNDFVEKRISEGEKVLEDEKVFDISKNLYTASLGCTNYIFYTTI